MANQLEDEIKNLEKNNNPDNYEELDLKQRELRLIREKKLKGILMRSKARWINEGEKPTNYFCHLENRHFVSKCMKSIILQNGEETMDFDLISKEVLQFYTDLFSSREHSLTNVDISDVLKEDTPKLQDAQSILLEGDITLKEAGKVLYNMKNGKSPGSTGFTTEFF